MCGIVGTNFLSDNFEKSIELIKHRGPDNQSSLTYKNNMFGHTRLSIIDLDSEANQPMTFDDIIITFNGEIYNYQELIKDENLDCKTKSDTEVLIRLYQKYGENFLDKLNGMFSFCIYDKKKDKFFCARDRFGKKPFYYYCKNGKFIYASEIKSILKLLDNTPKLNRIALEQYLTFWAPLNDNTFYNNIKKLPASHQLIFEKKQIRISRYFSLENIDTKYFDELESINDIEELLFRSIESRLVGDVDVASMLSGGIDSSLISSLYSKIGNNTIDTYSIGYDEYLHYSELDYARIVAKDIGSNHHEIIMSRTIFIETIDKMIEALDEPLGDSACIPTYLLSREIAQDSFKVALSGEGSDEIFLGYDKYFSMMDDKEPYLMINSAFSEEQKSSLFKNYQKIKYENIQVYKNRLQQMSYRDLKIWIPEVLMTKIDRMSMANSLELRAPFLDHRLVEYLLAVDSEIKKGDSNKHLLKKTVLKYLPQEIVNRRKKGFSSPFIEWLYEEYKDEVYNTIERVNKKLDIFNMDFVKFLYNEAKEKRFKQHMWNLYIFVRWFEKVYL